MTANRDHERYDLLIEQARHQVAEIQRAWSRMAKLDPTSSQAQVETAIGARFTTEALASLTEALRLLAADLREHLAAQARPTK